MEIPKGFTVGDGSDKYPLEVHHNIYGAKQGSQVWNKYWVKKLTSIGFQQLVTDDCIFFEGHCMYVLQNNDSILTEPHPEELDDIIHQIIVQTELIHYTINSLSRNFCVFT
jgi:hypothetical protein